MVSESESDKEQPGAAEGARVLSEAARARAERSRRRALELRAARLAPPPGGFVRAAEEAPRACAAPPAPFVHRSQQPRCSLCARPFPQSYLFDTFDHSVCDDCRDDKDAHRLVPRTEAKSEFLLKDCDLDARPPPLRCVRRANPHRAHGPDMRLYLRAQLLERALLVWGSLERLAEEREARDERRARVAAGAARKRMRALRMDVRSSLYDRTRASHSHAFGPETHDALADVYRRECECGHVETYEKM